MSARKAPVLIEEFQLKTDTPGKIGISEQIAEVPGKPVAHLVYQPRERL